MRRCGPTVYAALRVPAYSEAMHVSMVGWYWRTIACCSAVGTGLTVIFLMGFYLLFGAEFGWAHILDSAARGMGLGLITSLMVVAGTVATARHLNTGWGKGLFVLLTFVSPLLGWLLLGAVRGMLPGVLFEVPWLAVVLTVGATVIAAIATFFVPDSSPSTSPGDAEATELLERMNHGDRAPR